MESGTPRYTVESPTKIAIFDTPSLEYVVDNAWKPGHPPLRMIAAQTADRLNELTAEVERLRLDSIRLDQVEKIERGTTPENHLRWVRYIANVREFGIREALDRLRVETH